MLLFKLRLLLEEDLKLNCTKNVALNHLNSRAEWEVVVCSITSKQLRYYLIPNDHWTYNTRNLDFVETYFCRTNAFKYSFFSYSISEWNKLDPDLPNDKLYSTFRKFLLKSGRPRPNHVYKIHDPLGLKLLTRPILIISHLNEHRCNHNFNTCMNPLCSCSLKVESTKHFFLHCHQNTNIGRTI